jgi:upstream activation factor subunit UAF30
MADKKVAAKAPRKINSALSKPLAVSAELAEVIGKGPMPRTEVVKKLWVYIKKTQFTKS